MGSQPTPSPLRLAILMADTPLPGTQAKFKTYGGVFTHLFERAVAPDPIAAHLSITTHDVVNDLASYPDLDAVDAVLITGSRHSAFEKDEWIVKLVEFTRKAIASNRVRFVGVCFGHQICGRALGVPVDRGPGGWEVSVTDVELSEAGREFFGMQKMVSWFTFVQDTYLLCNYGRSMSDEKQAGGCSAKDELDQADQPQRIHQMHRDAVFSYPAHAIPLAETEVCPVQGMLIPGRVLTIQGHPEFTEGIVREILEMRHDAGIFTDDIYKSGIDRVASEHDGVVIAKAFLRFMRE